MADGIYYNPEPQLTVATVSIDNQTLNAGSFSSFGIATTKAGYSPIGVVGWEIENASSSGTNATYLSVYRLYIGPDTGKVWFYLRNNSSNNAKFKATAHVLYRKD